MKIEIKINMGNDAMQTADDVASLLEEAAAIFRSHGLRSKRLLDVNGNAVGEIRVDP